MFSYPPDLVDEILRRWRSAERNQELAYTPEAPNPAVIRQLLEVCFQASFRTEEQRQVSFTVALIEPPERALMNRSGPLTSRKVPIRFSEPRPFSVSEVTRLAPATEPLHMFICVQVVEGKLEIWGLLQIAIDWIEFLQRETDSTSGPVDALTVTSSRPGAISVSRLGLVLARLEDGEVIIPRDPTLQSSEIASFFGPSQTDMRRQVGGGLTTDIFKGNPDYDGYLDTEYQRQWERLLLQIRDKGHGGTVLVVRDGEYRSGDELSDQLRIKYQADVDDLWGLLSNLLTSKANSAAFEMSEGAEPVPSQEADQLTGALGYRDEVRIFEKAVASSTRLLASVTGVDGAVVLTDRFRLFGFGAEITSESGPSEVMRVGSAPGSELASVENFGTRHRSAFRFCYCVPNSLAFIVSQDGQIRVAMRRGDEVLFWPELSFGEFGL
jgi:hypothetical protein